MSDENKQKMSVKEKVQGFLKKILNILTAPFRLILNILQKILRIVVPVFFIIAAFVLGARMHETGYLAGSFKKDLKGATVRISGNCLVKGKPRMPSLAEDQVKITYIDGEKIQAVVRQTREMVECKLAEVAIDTLPLLDYVFGKKMEEIPALTAQVEAVASAPEYKKLEKKTLVMSGSCTDLQDKILPSFTDEKVDVTAVEGVEGNAERFVLMGIKKNDQQAIKCLSTAIKYSEYIVKADGVETNSLGNSQNKSYVGETLVITGTCFPDERTKVNKMKKYLFYKLANTKIQILEHDLAKDGSINRLVGTVLDDEFRGDAVYCDKQKFPFIYKEYDEESMKLEKGSKAESETPAEAQAPAINQ